MTRNLCNERRFDGYCSRISEPSAGQTFLPEDLTGSNNAKHGSPTSSDCDHDLDPATSDRNQESAVSPWEGMLSFSW
jgi:hypothetical protein